MGSGVHGQLVGEMIRAALREVAPPIRWSIRITEGDFERGIVRLNLLFDLGVKTFGAAVEKKTVELTSANVGGDVEVERFRAGLVLAVRMACREIRRAADDYLAKL